MVIFSSLSWKWSPVLTIYAIAMFWFFQCFLLSLDCQNIKLRKSIKSSFELEIKYPFSYTPEHALHFNFKYQLQFPSLPFCPPIFTMLSRTKIYMDIPIYTYKVHLFLKKRHSKIKVGAAKHVCVNSSFSNSEGCYRMAWLQVGPWTTVSSIRWEFV